MAAGESAVPLPDASAIAPWEAAGAPRLWQAADLYGYINGGAELFLDLGFDRLAVRTYALERDEIVVEVYEMSDPVAGLGAWLAQTGPPAPDPSLDLRHTVGRYELQFVKGRHYVKLQNVSGRPEHVDALLTFARATAANIPDVSFHDPTTALPEEGRIPGSTRIIRGPISLQSVYSLGSGDVLSLGTERVAVSAAYRSDEDDRFTVILADYGSTSAAAGALRHLTENLDPYLDVLETSPSHLLLEDYNGRFGLAVVDGTRLRIRVGLDQRPAPGDGKGQRGYTAGR